LSSSFPSDPILLFPLNPIPRNSHGTPCKTLYPYLSELLRWSTPPHLPLKSHDVSTSLWIQLPKGGGLISLFPCVQVVRYISTSARPRLRTSHYAGCYPPRPQLFYNSVSDSYIYPRPIVSGLAYTPKLHLPTSNPTQHNTNKRHNGDRTHSLYSRHQSHRLRRRPIPEEINTEEGMGPILESES
jgi:hypothetical protein